MSPDIGGVYTRNWAGLVTLIRKMELSSWLCSMTSYARQCCLESLDSTNGISRFKLIFNFITIFALTRVTAAQLHNTQSSLHQG